MAHKHGVARGPYDHTQHGDPQVGHADRGPGAIPDAQHVAHGFEEGIRVLLTPGNVLQGRRMRQRQKGGRKGETERGVGELLQGKAGEEGSPAGRMDRLSFNVSLNLYQTLCHTHSSCLTANALAGWLNFRPVFFLPLFFQYPLCLDLALFISHLPKGAKQLMFASTPK